MPTFAPTQSSDRISPEFSRELGPLVEVASDRSSALSDPTLPAVPVSAKQAVEQVLLSADRTFRRDGKTVSLQFTVGEADLRVRVELRGNKIHTTFLTDSPALRTVLTQEWQSLTSESPERFFRFEAPVILSQPAGGAGLGTQAGDSSSRHQNSHPHDATGEANGRPAGRNLPVAGAVEGSAPNPAPTAGTSSTSRHLSTHA